jgi:hypothetical protein
MPVNERVVRPPVLAIADRGGSHGLEMVVLEVSKTGEALKLRRLEVVVDGHESKRS